MITEIHITGDELNALNKKVGGIHMPKQMTEQEYIQTCDTEHLAEWIYKTQYRSANIPRQSWMKDNKDSIMENIEEWLKQPHK